MSIVNFTIARDDLVANIEIHQDDDCENPNDISDCQVFNAERGVDLEAKAKEVFGDRWARRLATLAKGQRANTEDAWYFGIEEYRHSGSAFALCSAPGNFPDRQWDVIELAGWVKIPFSVGIAEEYLEKAALGVLKDWQAYVNGECYGFTVVVTKDGEEIDSDSCWGFVADFDYCKESAKSAAEFLLNKWSGHWDPPEEPGEVAAEPQPIAASEPEEDWRLAPDVAPVLEVEDDKSK